MLARASEQLSMPMLAEKFGGNVQVFEADAGITAGKQASRKQRKAAAANKLCTCHTGATAMQQVQKPIAWDPAGVTSVCAGGCDVQVQHDRQFVLAVVHASDRSAFFDYIVYGEGIINNSKQHVTIIILWGSFYGVSQLMPCWTRGVGKLLDAVTQFESVFVD